MELAPRAAEVAESFVKPLGRRWLHVQAVATRAAELEQAVAPGDRDTLRAAAWLHDIGYAPEIGHTRFHPLDGARYLRGQGWPDTIVNLVAHHSGARFEAEERGLYHELADFPFEDSPLLDTLAAADLTTGPAGEHFTYDERMDEILSRYSPDNAVHRTWTRARPVIAKAVARTEHRLARGSQSSSTS
ncbi:putative nucleotidyltransferase with HDIG domain [Saccharopolyspora lacisalsi]|uniref:Putative nucleotidyltransferase with HDIG domain n=1 Tax=Halosaccharopolyspora lacisalsi TaxID=1000566 RepID=A0A839E1X9_9PSEU|nr:HD domain-containing protein [Halosaccharopolyspora lacisalsi]MBA8827080.1 putative nucleotidyltransferase with HDIG domain [Halosaccharopolyspora lacisalsi]